MPGGHESPSGAFKPQTGLRSKCRVFSAARSQRFRCAGPDGLRHPASASCLGRHSHPAGRCPNSSSLYPPLAAVVAVANKGCSPLIIPRQRSKRKNASRFAQTGCGAQRPLRALSGTRVLLTAAPTAPPCIRRWRRSSPLHFFLASPICRPLSRCATALRRGAGAADTAVSVTTPPVKMRLERPAGHDKREYKNNFSTDYGQSARGGHFK